MTVRGLAMMMGTGKEPFIDSFCDVSLIPDHFRGMLGRFTPCFTDVVVLGSAHLTAIALCAARLAQLRHTGAPLYRLTGASRTAHCAAAVLSALCLLVVSFQLNARLAADASPLISGRAAPFEWAGYSLALLSWSLFISVFLLELRRYSPSRTYLWRFPAFLVFAAQLAKLQFVVSLSEERNYFYYLFLSYVAFQGGLVLLAALHFPPADQMDPVQPLGELGGATGAAYQPLPSRTEGEEDVCPEVTAGLVSRLLFSWMGGLMVKGYRSPLHFEDIWKLPPGDRVDALNARFELEWGKEMEAAARKQEPSLVAACWRCTRSLFLTSIPWKLASDAAQFVGPIFLKLLLGTVAAAEAGGSSSRGYFYAAAMLVGLVIGVIGDNQQFQRSMRAGFQLRSMLTFAIFRKLLFMAPAARAQFTSGRLYSAVGADVDAIQQLCMNLLGLISSPLRIVGALALLYQQLGAAAWVTLGLLAALMPVQAWLMRKTQAVMRSNLQYSDERSKLEGELMGGIDVAKCYAWEDSFLSRVLGVRKEELRGLWRTFVISALNTSIITSVPVLSALGSFGAYSLLSSEPLTAAQAFTSLTLLSILQMPLFQLPMLISGLVSAGVSAGRLKQVLASEEQPPLSMLPPAAPGAVAVSVEGEFSWDAESPPALVDVKFQAPAGSLVAVVGSTGAGKSSLLSAALGLMNQVAGPAPLLRGAVAFVPQAPFIVNDTVRGNILFGAQYQEERYREAVRAASLEHDLQQLPGGDQTELGDKGVNVSGGQKQRVALARAVYSGADVVLLDDPLSALDAKVGRRVFRECIMGALSKCTRVLVTNQLQFARSADLVAFMQDGEIREFGTCEELLAAGKGFAAAMAQAQAEGDDDDVEEEEELGEGEEGVGQDGAAVPSSAAGSAASPSTALLSSQAEAGQAPAAGQAQPQALAAPSGAPPSAASGRLTTEEGRSQGAVSAAVVWAYVMAMGGALAALAVLCMLVAVEGARVASQLWLQRWTTDVDAAGGSAPLHPTLWYLGWYCALGAVQVLAGLAAQFLFRSRALAATWELHAALLRSLLRAPMAFFNTTPLGRIVNRLTKDTADVDRTLPDFTQFYLRSLLQLASTLVLVAALNPFTLWMLTPCLLGFYLLYAYFQATVREVKRLDAISRSPLYSALGEAVGGLATIRALRVEGKLLGRCGSLLDRNVACSLVSQSANRWLSVRLESLGAGAAFAAAVLAVEQRGAAAVLGNILSSALALTPLVSMTVRAASLAELGFNAVERVDEYSRLPQEAAAIIPGSTPPGWPSKGEIKFEGVRMRYRPGLPLVLKGLTCTIPGGSSCGVVGRTGAGKSSLINALFRLAEVEGGSIRIDTVDAARVGLTQLRSAMALIPQSPVLFTGTIRFNLSPFGEHTDAELWGALRRAHLAPAIQATPLGLDMVISEGGAPLSAGQKQLLALARALLRHCRVLVLDEATANVDLETDALLQKTVRSEFSGCTVLSIAHRLHTIIDADQVLVMDGGRAAEVGPPAQLLAKPDGIFADMVRETGEATERMLRQLAAGEAQAQGSWDAAAQHALQRLASAPHDREPSGALAGECAYRLSKDLEQAAAAAAAAVRSALESIQESSEEFEGEEDNLGAAAAASAATASLRHAFLLVDQVRQLAEQAQHSAPRPMGCTAANPGGTPRAGPGLGASSSRSLEAGLPREGMGVHTAAADSGSPRSPLVRRATSGTLVVAAEGSAAGGGSLRRLRRGLSGAGADMLGAVLGGLSAGGGSRRRLLREDPSIASNPGI